MLAGVVMAWQGRPLGNWTGCHASEEETRMEPTAESLPGVNHVLAMEVLRQEAVSTAKVILHEM